MFTQDNWELMKGKRVRIKIKPSRGITIVSAFGYLKRIRGNRVTLRDKQVGDFYFLIPEGCRVEITPAPAKRAGWGKWK